MATNLVVPKEIGLWIKNAFDDDTLDLRNLHASLTDKDIFKAIHKTRGSGARLSRTQKKAESLAEYIQLILTDRSEAWIAENKTSPKNVRLRHLNKFLRSIQKDSKDSIRLPIVNIMEQEFERSEYPRTERFRRIQFYNEPSLISSCPNSSYSLPTMDNECGMPCLEYSQLGYGIPTACLEHLLRIGLLRWESHNVKCFRHRKSGMVDCCTLDCPYLK